MKANSRTLHTGTNRAQTHVHIVFFSPFQATDYRKKIDIDASAVRTSSVCDDDLVKGRTARVSRALHSLGVVFSSNYAIENHAFDHCAAARATNRAPPDENRVNDRQRVRLASRAWCLYQKRGSSPMAGPSV